MNGPLHNIFTKHGMHRAFTVYLQHRHHHVRHGEAVVKVNGTAHVMDENEMATIIGLGNQIVPCTWMSCGLEILPMEFRVIPEWCR